jgi:ribosome-associated protein
MAALDRKAAAVLVFNLTDLTTMADYFVLSTASSDRQARAIADAILERLGPAGSVEGMQNAHWILLDYGDVVFHVFQEEARRFYALERLWGDAQNDTGIFAGRPAFGGAATAADAGKRPS